MTPNPPSLRHMTVLDRIMKCAEPITESGCFIWTLCCTKRGYGRIAYNGKSRLVASVLYEALRGEIPKGLYVCHRCDVPSCVNIEHLFLGTPTDNMQDSKLKGRHASKRGEKNGRAKLTAEQVQWARQQYASGDFSTRALGKILGIANATISDILTRKRWVHV